MYDFLKDNDYKPFIPSHISIFCTQLLTAVAFLHDIKLVHTDIKPENILLEQGDYVVNGHKPYFKSDSSKHGPIRMPKKLKIRLIDFGSATFDHKYHTKVVSTRHYRAPEVLLELPWYDCFCSINFCLVFGFLTSSTFVGPILSTFIQSALFCLSCLLATHCSKCTKITNTLR